MFKLLLAISYVHRLEELMKFDGYTTNSQESILGICGELEKVRDRCLLQYTGIFSTFYNVDDMNTMCDDWMREWAEQENDDASHESMVSLTKYPVPSASMRNNQGEFNHHRVCNTLYRGTYGSNRKLLINYLLLKLRGYVHSRAHHIHIVPIIHCILSNIRHTIRKMATKSPSYKLNVKEGLCIHLAKRIPLDKTITHLLICKYLSTSWPKYSDDHVYPIPGINTSPINGYNCADSLFHGDYGSLRLELLDHWIDSLTPHLNGTVDNVLFNSTHRWHIHHNLPGVLTPMSAQTRDVARKIKKFLPEMILDGHATISDTKDKL